MMKTIFGLIVVCTLIITGYYVVRTMSIKTSHAPVTTHLDSTHTPTNVNPRSLYPAVQISCNNSASAVPLSPDYLITGMDCTSPATGNSLFMICNGTIMQRAANVSLSCFRPADPTANRLQCIGSTNAAANPTDLALSYTCSLPNLIGNNLVYSCSGVLSGYSSHAINLPISTSCS